MNSVTQRQLTKGRLKAPLAPWYLLSHNARNLWPPVCHQALRANTSPVVRLILPITCKGNVLNSAAVEVNSVWSELQMAGQIRRCLPHQPKKGQKGEYFFDDGARILKAFSGRCITEPSRIGSPRRQPNLSDLIYLQLYCKKQMLSH